MLSIILLILLNSLRQPIQRDEKTITVKTFYDYQVQMSNVDDILIINCPSNTFVFISSKDGYEATAYNSETQEESTKIGEITPDPRNRLIYFKEKGSIRVTSKKASLNFKFHTLPIDKLGGFSENNIGLIISSKQNNEIHLTGRFANTYHASYYEIDERKSIYLWLISDETNICYINGLYTYYLSREKEDNEDPISGDNSTYTHFSQYDVDKIKYHVVSGKSKFLKKLENCEDDIKYNVTTKQSKNTNEDFYGNYIAFVDPKTLEKSSIIERGKDRLGTLYIIALPDGINSLDFSMANKVSLRIDFATILFPNKGSVDIEDLDDEIYGYNWCEEADESLYINPKLEAINDEEIDFHVIKIKKRDYTSIYVTMNPNDHVKIGSNKYPDITYANDFRDYYYIMGSQRETYTKVNFSSGTTFYKIKDKSIESISVKNLESIKGPFFSVISIGSYCSFTTTTEEEFEEKFEDNCNNVCYFLNKESYYISRKYGQYKKKTLANLKYNRVYLFDTVKIKTICIVHISNNEGWKAEIVNSDLPLEEREFGPHLGKKTLYVRLDGEEDKYLRKPENCQFFIYNTMPNSYFEQYLSLHVFIHTIVNGFHTCDKLLVFNGLQASFRITAKKESNSIQLSPEKTLCMLPLFSKSPFEYNISNGTDGEIRNFGPQGDSYIHILENNMAVCYCKNENMKVDITFTYVPRGDLYTFSNDYDYYSLTDLETTPGLYFIENEITPIPTPIPEPDDDIFEGEIYQIEKNGYKYVAMNNERQKFTIKCPNRTLLYIHNIDDIEAECYSNGELFAKINSISTNRIISFADDGEVIINKIPSSNDLTLFYSYVYPFDYKQLYICSSPNATVTIGPEKLSPNMTLNLYSDEEPSFLWFTYPYDVKLNIFKALPNVHNISIDKKEIKTIIDKNNDFVGKGFEITVGIYYYDVKDLYTRFNVSPINDFSLLLNSNVRYHVINSLVEINHTKSVIVEVKQESDDNNPTDKDPNGGGDDDDNLGIIVVVVCCVGGVIVIVIIVVVVIVIKKRKKNAQASTSQEVSDNVEQ